MAAYMFSRFMFKSGFDKNCEEQEEGVEQYTWDVAIACVALSVKVWPQFHSKFNQPTVITDAS